MSDSDRPAPSTPTCGTCARWPPTSCGGAFRTTSFRCPQAGGDIVLAEDGRPCHEPIRAHRPEPVASTCETCANFSPAWNTVDFNEDEGWCRLERSATGYADVWPCHVRPEPVAPPGMKPYNERPKGSAFGPPLKCEACDGEGEWWIGEDHAGFCHPCDGNGYVNAVRREP